MHPVHVEAVAGVVGRADILAGIFFLLSLICHQKYSLTGRRQRSQLICDQQINLNTKPKTSNQLYISDACENNNNSTEPISHQNKAIYDKNGNENASNADMKCTKIKTFRLQVNVFLNFPTFHLIFKCLYQKL